MSMYDDENNLFLDIPDEAPLFSNRRPTCLIGGVFYYILLAGFVVFAMGAIWIFHPVRGLVFQLLCSCNVALLVISGTAAMLLVMVLDLDISILSIFTLLRIIMLAEVVCAASFMTLYIGYVHQYNSFDSQPDVLKSLYSPLQPSNSLEGPS